MNVTKQRHEPWLNKNLKKIKRQTEKSSLRDNERKGIVMIENESIEAQIMINTEH